MDTCKKLTLSPWGPVGPFSLLSSPCSPYMNNIVKQKTINSISHETQKAVQKSMNVLFKGV